MSLMACSGCAVRADFWFEGPSPWKNKKGPKRPPCTPSELGWPQPSPAVRLGTTTIRSLVILLLILPLGLPKGCANIAPNPGKSREGGATRDFLSLTGFRPFGEQEFCWSSHAARGSARLRAGRNEGRKPPLRLFRPCPLEFRQLMPEPGELALGVMPGVSTPDRGRLLQRDLPGEMPDQRRHPMGLHRRQQA